MTIRRMALNSGRDALITDTTAEEAEHWYERFVGATDDHETSPFLESRDKLRDRLKRSADQTRDKKSR